VAGVSISQRVAEGQLVLVLAEVLPPDVNVKERDVTNGSCEKGEEETRQAEDREGEEDRGTEDFEEEVALTAQRSVLKRRWLVQTDQRPSFWGASFSGRRAA
jgi:hypothetical protein